MRLNAPLLVVTLCAQSLWISKTFPGTLTCAGSGLSIVSPAGVAGGELFRTKNNLSKLATATKKSGFKIYGTTEQHRDTTANVHMVRVMLGRIFVMPTNVGPWAWDLGIRERWWTGNCHRLYGCRVEVTIVDLFFFVWKWIFECDQDRDRHPRESWLFWEIPGGALTNGNQEHWNRCTLAWLWYRIDAFWLCVFFTVIFVEGLLRWTKKINKLSPRAWRWLTTVTEVTSMFKLCFRML